MDRYEREERPAPMPDTEHAQALVRWFGEVGPCAQGAMGPVPIGWTDLLHWCSLTATSLQPWQARALRSASSAYVAQLHESSAPDCPAPWQPEPDADQRARVDRQIRAMLGGRPGPPRTGLVSSG